MRRVSVLACVATAAMLIAACSSTKILTSWKAEDFTSQKLNKVLVIGMMGARDQEIRQTVENAMVEQLKANGVNAVAATQQYGPRTFRDMKEEDAVKMVAGDSFDGVLVIELIDKNKEKYYTPGYVSYTPYGAIRGHWWPHYAVLYDRIYSPGYYTTSTNYTLEVNLYDAKKEKLDYSAQARSFDPGSPNNLATDFSKTVVADMLKQGIIIK
jgi:hypothetical protein